MEYYAKRKKLSESALKSESAESVEVKIDAEGFTPASTPIS